METGLIIPQDSAISNYDEQTLQDMSKTGDWLPRISIMGSMSKLVSSGKTQIGTVALITTNDSFVNLGKEVDVIFCAWRPRSMMTPAGSTPVSYFDPTDPKFLDIQARSEVKNSNCFYGPEFLIWVPNQKKFATFFLSSKSARREGPACLALMKDANGGPNRPGNGTVRATYIEPKGSTYAWWGPKITACSMPLSPLPEQENFEKELMKFKNPPKVVVAEKAQDLGQDR